MVNEYLLVLPQDGFGEFNSQTLINFCNQLIEPYIFLVLILIIFFHQRSQGQVVRWRYSCLLHFLKLTANIRTISSLSSSDKAGS